MSDRDKAMRDRIKAAGLSQRKIVVHPDDVDDVRSFARKLYEKRGITLSHPYNKHCGCDVCKKRE